MLLRFRLLLFIGLVAPFVTIAQSTNALLPGTNVERLLEMAREFKAQEIRERAEAEAFAREHGLPIRLEDSLETIEIRRIENGIPHYYTVENITAAYTLNTDDLWNGGALGLNIEGQNMIVGEWDGGGVLTTHQEFVPASGVTSRAIQQDAPITSNYHATHVAGTLIAEGQVAAAKGMAHRATLHAYDWNSDNSEMAAAAANGLLISNHSYGSVSGWRYNSSASQYEWWGNPSETQDYRFGQYSYDASQWDGIAYNAPYYLIVKSAGNDRGDSGADPYYIYNGGWVLSSQPSSFREIDGGPDGYDCIPTNGNAKNILTVGAVGDISAGWSQASDVSMSSFSGWGPTDDGRIKPDVVGNGIGLYSTYNTSNTSYQSLNGTSMAAPNVTGSLILLQQLYMDSVGSYMRAATLKGLAIHTANEAGANPGPDYANGWGLVDMNRAAQVIMNSEGNAIVENTLSNGGTYSLSFVSDGSTPVSATICWTDPAGTYQSSVLNESTLRLVNDLDMVITNGFTTYQPWVLDPANPANPATTGDNFRDNVEKIEAGVIPAGNWVLNVTHKGSLSGGSQAFSLILSGKSGVPSAGFSVSQSAICQGDVVTLTDASAGGATSFSWSISPATGWSFTNGTNANSQNPQISVSASSGYFSVTQTVSNSFGSSSVTTDSVIKVGGYELPYFNDLETEELRNELTINNPDGDITWSFVSNSVNTNTLKMDNYTTNVSGTMDWVILPRLDLTNFTSAQLEFDYAYTYYPGYYDTLLVAISNGCGNTIYSPVFYTGGTQLASSASTTSSFLANLASQWCDGGSVSCPSIDLSAYVGMAEVSIAFINKSGYANNLYLDNFSVTGTRLVPLVISDSSITHVSCNGESTGSAGVTIGGGITPYSYLWSNGATTSSISGLSTGTYGVTITDQNSTQVTGSYAITEPSALSASASSTNESILGYADGTASASVTGGVLPYSYLWSNGQNSASLSGLSAGTYTVTITDDNNCTTTASASVSAGVDTLKISNSAVTNLSCYQDLTGSIFITVTGGSTPYSYLWDYAGASTGNLSGLNGGSYAITVSDNSGQQVTQIFTITEPSELTLSVSGADETVVGQNNGSASVVASGGTGTYTYAWSNGATTASITNLSPATYTLTVTDANNCIKSSSFTVNGGASILSLDAASPTNLTCYNDASGGISISLSGGTTPYVYIWSNGATSPSINGLNAGTYAVTASDQSGQQVTGSYTLTEPVLLSSSITKANESVAGANDGSASVVASGGTGAYSYAWSNGATTASISGLSPGNYAFTVTDANLCTTGGSVNINSGISVLAIASSTASNLNCFQDASGSAGITLTGGTTPYSYIWSNGATTASISGLSAGTYTVTASDQSGQQVTGSYTLTEPNALTISPSSTNESIAGANDGSASVVASGGTGAYSYAWSNGATTASISNLAPGNYTFTITDANLCTVSGGMVISGGVPVLAIASTQNSNLNCFQDASGSAGITLTGGTTPYSYIWSNGATTASISGLSAGTYTVTASDQSGQQVTGSYTLTEPTALSGLLAVNNQTVVSQNDGSIDALIQGGTPFVTGAPYQYAWSNGGTTSQITNLSPGTYTLTVTDSLGCSVTFVDSVETGADLMNIVGLIQVVSCAGGNDGAVDAQIIGGQQPYTYLWSTGATTQDVGNLSAGIYTLSASDAVGQTDVQNFLVAEPLPLSTTTSSQDETVQGYANGSASVSAAGGTSPYSYLWSNGATTSSISNLAPGMYYVTVTDFKNCTQTDSASVGVGVPVLQWSISTVQVSCNGGANGAISITPTGGAAPVTFVWSNGAAGATLNNLTAGMYAVTATDALGQTLDSVLVIQEPPALSVAFVITDESVQGVNDGALAATASGGTGTYTYSWSNGGSSASINNLSAATYTLTVTDSLGCELISTATVGTGVPVLSVVVLDTMVSCFGAADGSIALQVSGGGAPIQIVWSTGDTTSVISGLLPGVYAYTVTDVVGQQVSGSATITEPTVLALSTVVTDESIQGLQDGSVSVLVTGGTSPYQYLWSNGLTMSTLNNLGPGYYACTITDANGCVAVTGDTVFDGIPLLQEFTTYLHPACFGDSSGSISVAASGGVPPYSWSWSTGDSITSLQGLTAGLYVVTLTDQSGQSVVDSTQLIYPFALSITGSVSGESVLGYSDGSVAVAGAGGFAPYSWAWSTGASSDSIYGLMGGVYTVTLTDYNNCTLIDSFVVSSGVDTLRLALTGTNPDCFGGSNGAIDLAVIGGSAPFVYQWSQGSIVEDLTGLTANIYYVTVTDALNQMALGSITLSEPSALQASISLGDETVAGYQDGTASVAVSGGTPPYIYLWSNGATADSIGGLSAGVYGVTVTDSLGCSTALSDTVFTGVPVLQASAQGQNILCFGGTTGFASIAVVGGAAPYVFLWSNGTTSASITSVSAGPYAYTVTDGVGQTATGSINLTEPLPLTASATITNETVTGQNDGSLSLTPAGGTAPYSLAWSTGSSANPLTGLAPGDYTYTLTDANGCTLLDTLTILAGAPLLSVTGSITDESCANNGDGAIQLTVSGGLAPYNVVWSSGATSSGITGLSAGTYTVSVTDGSGQLFTGSYTVAAPTPLVLSGTTSQPTAFGASDGSISLAISGGTPGYVFSWSDGSSLSSRVGLAAGTYAVTVTDNQGCFATGSWVLSNPAPPALNHSFTVVPVSCFDGADGSATVSAVGGVGPYSIVWSDGSTNFVLNGLQSGSYGFTVSDGAGQQSSGVAVVAQPAALSVEAFESTPGSLYAVVSGGTYPYFYSWSTSPALTDSAITVPMGAEYEVVVTDANGCMADAFVTSTLSEPEWARTLKIYPNPGSDALTISATGVPLERVRVRDVSGRIIFEQPVLGERQLLIRTSSWAAGSYSIQIQTPYGTAVVKWMLSR